MKNLLFILLLCTAPNIFCLNQEDAQRINESKKIAVLFNELTRSIEESHNILEALGNLHQACNDAHECKVTDEASKEILQKHGLVDSEGNVRKETCETLDYIEKNPHSLRLLH